MKITKSCKKLASIAGLALGLTLGAGSAQSALLYSFEDDDIDFALRGTTVITSGPLLVGDVLVSALQIPSFLINGVNGIPAGQEMTGVAAIQLLGCTTSGGLATPCSSGPGTNFIFGAPTLGLNFYLALGTDPDATVGAPGAAGGGAVVALFLNGTSGAGGDIDLELSRSILPATNCISLADCLDQASRGTLFQVDGFTVDPDNFWLATQGNLLPGAATYDAILAANNSLILTSVNFGLGTFFNANGPVEFHNLATGLECGTPGPIADGCVQLSGSATITGGTGLVNGAFAHSDFDALKYVGVPEPGTVALLALGLLGLGAGLRRRRA